MSKEQIYRAALERIAGKEAQAREAVEKQWHNTTFAIDLAGMARLALEEADILPTESAQPPGNIPALLESWLDPSKEFAETESLRALCIYEAQS